MKPLPSYKFLIAVGLLLAAAMSLSFLIFGQRGLLELCRLRRQHDSVEQGNAELRFRNQALARQVDALRHDPVTIERLARERLGMVKEGEVVYYLPKQTAESGPTAAKQMGLKIQGAQ